MDLDVEEENDHSILHKAVGILRDEISKLTPSTDYPTPAGVSLAASAAFVPPLLAKTMTWLINKDAFESAGPAHQIGPAVQRRSLSLAECIIFCSTKMLTPLHLGLAVQMHHDYGKRGLIDTLNSHGFSAGYYEVRRFSTAVGNDQVQRMQAETYLPSGIIPVVENGCLIQEGDDNVDINTETVDGKNTFHTMA